MNKYKQEELTAGDLVYRLQVILTLTLLASDGVAGKVEEMSHRKRCFELSEQNNNRR